MMNFNKDIYEALTRNNKNSNFGSSENELSEFVGSLLKPFATEKTVDLLSNNNEQIRPLPLRGYAKYNQPVMETQFKANPLLTGLLLYDEITSLPFRAIQKRNIDKRLNKFVIDKHVPLEYTNALRHRGGSAFMSNSFLSNPTRARYLGNIKEISDLLLKKEDDTPTDLANNELGRRIAEQYKGISQDELLNKVYDDILENPTPPPFKDTQIMQSLWDNLR